MDIVVRQISPSQNPTNRCPFFRSNLECYYPGGGPQFVFLSENDQHKCFIFVTFEHWPDGVWVKLKPSWSGVCRYRCDLTGPCSCVTLRSTNASHRLESFTRVLEYLLSNY